MHEEDGGGGPCLSMMVILDNSSPVCVAPSQSIVAMHLRPSLDRVEGGRNEEDSSGCDDDNVINKFEFVLIIHNR